MTLNPLFLAGAVFGALAASAFVVLAAIIADVARRLFRRGRRPAHEPVEHEPPAPVARSIVYGVDFSARR